MRKLAILLVAGLLLLALCLHSNTALVNAQNDTNASSVKLISIELAKNNFIVNDTVEGKLKILLSGPMKPDEEISLRLLRFLGSTEKTLTLKEALVNASIKFAESEGKKEAANPGDSKSIAIINGSKQSVIVKMPQYSNVESIEMDITPSAGNTLKDVRIDVNVNGDGQIEWYYLGDFTGWEDTFVKPAGLSEIPGSVLKIKNNDTMYCQLLDLPYSKDYNLTAQYKKLGAGGDIWAAVLRLDSNPQYPSDDIVECDLPELADFGWGSCAIHSDYGVPGKNQVCIYSKTKPAGAETDLYSINADAGPTDTAYTCSLGSIECTALPVFDPFIKLKGAKYSKVLDKTVKLSQWEYSFHSVLLAFWRILGSSIENVGDFTPICTSSECAVELSVLANGSGQVTLSNLNIIYKYGIADSEEHQIFEMASVPSMITQIGIGGNQTADLNQTNVTIELPLSIFGLKAPSPIAESGSKNTLKASFKGQEAEAEFTVYAPGVQVGSERLITETKESLDTLLGKTGDEALVLKILGLDTIITEAKSELSSYQSRLASAGDTPAIQAEIEAFRLSLPKEIVFEASFKDFQFIEPDDITSDIVPVGKKEDTYFMQEKVQVKAEVSAFVMRTFAGDETRYALVKKELTAKAPLEKIDVFESIEKTVVDSTDDIKFEETPASIVKKDPIARWFIASLSTGAKKNFNYAIKTDFDVSIDSTKTIIANSETEEQSEAPDEDQAECGDGVCTVPLEDDVTCPDDCKNKLPWASIIIIVAVSFVLLLYILFYRGKYSIYSLFKKKMPFSSNTQLKAVNDYILKSRSENVNDADINKKLLEKGWTAEQVRYAFSALSLNKQQKPKPSDLKPMQDYIKAALSKGISKEFILKKLVAQGWDANMVRKELGFKK